MELLRSPLSPTLNVNLDKPIKGADSAWLQSMTDAELVEHLVSNGRIVSKESINLDPLEPELQRAILQALVLVTEMFPQGTETFPIKEIAADTAENTSAWGRLERGACVGLHGITINSAFYSSEKVAKAKIEGTLDILLNEISATMIHEYGHHMDNQLNPLGKRFVDDQIRASVGQQYGPYVESSLPAAVLAQEELGAYARLSREELIAEAIRGGFQGIDGPYTTAIFSAFHQLFGRQREMREHIEAEYGNIADYLDVDLQPVAVADHVAGERVTIEGSREYKPYRSAIRYVRAGNELLLVSSDRVINVTKSIESGELSEVPLTESDDVFLTVGRPIALGHKSDAFFPEGFAESPVSEIVSVHGYLFIDTNSNVLEETHGQISTLPHEILHQLASLQESQLSPSTDSRTTPYDISISLLGKTVGDISQTATIPGLESLDKQVTITGVDGNRIVLLQNTAYGYNANDELTDVIEVSQESVSGHKFETGSQFSLQSATGDAELTIANVSSASMTQRLPIPTWAVLSNAPAISQRFQHQAAQLAQSTAPLDAVSPSL